MLFMEPIAKYTYVYNTVFLSHSAFLLFFIILGNIMIRIELDSILTSLNIS